MLLDLEIALRYVRGAPQRKDRFISFISGLSMAGIGLGVAALIVVISVMNGFQKEVRDRMLAVIAHIEVLAPSTGFQDINALQTTIKTTHSGIVGIAPYVSGQSMLAHGEKLQGVLVRGIIPASEPQVSTFSVLEGEGLNSLEPGAFRVLLGLDLARQLGLEVGSRITLFAPTGQVSPAGVIPRLRAFTVAGLVASGHFEYDSALVLMNLEDAARFYRSSGATGLRIKLANMQDAPKIAQRLQKSLPNDVWVRDWSIQNRTWFAAVQTEKRMMFIILTLIIAVAAFNLVSMLVMTVKDKQSEIAILRTLGASPANIGRIFMFQGALVGWIGTSLGVGFGTLLAFNLGKVVGYIERMFHVEFLPKSIYLISSLPSDPRLSDITTIGLTALVLSILATIYPSWRASKAQPAQALRYE